LIEPIQDELSNYEYQLVMHDLVQRGFAKQIFIHECCANAQSEHAK
jgi:hypothetical protein